MSYAAIHASKDFRDFVQHYDTTGRESDFVDLDDYLLAWLQNGRGVAETGAHFPTFLQTVIFITVAFGARPNDYLSYGDGEWCYNRRIEAAFEIDPVTGAGITCLDQGVYQKFVLLYHERLAFPAAAAAA
jgi:hypothetical protein